MFFGPGGKPLPGVNTPLPHSAPNAGTSPFYKIDVVVNPNAYPGAPGIIGPHAFGFFPQFGTDYKGGGDYFFYNFAAVTPELPPADRQSFYGSFIRDICDKYLTGVFRFQGGPLIFRFVPRSGGDYSRSIQDPRHEWAF